MNERYLVSTTMGDTLVDPNSWVYVPIDYRHFVRKRPYELSIGDMVVFPKPYARARLEDVEPHLIKSPRYARAMDIIHERNSRRELIPKLRALLIRGMLNQGFFGDTTTAAEIERKIMQEGINFESQDYASMDQQLRQLIAPHEDIRIGEDTPEGWLRGWTKAPFGFSRMGARVLEVFGEALNPAFREWVYHDTNPTSIYFNYRLQRVIRNRIMWYLNECRGTHIGGDGMQREQEDGISVSPEFELILRHFFRDISHDLAATRVTEIMKLDSNRQIRSASEHSFHLGEGITKETTGFLDSSLKNMLELFSRQRMLECCFIAAMEDYEPLELHPSMIEFARNLTVSNPQRFARYIFSSAGEPILLEHFGDPLDDEMKFYRDHQDRQLPDLQGASANLPSPFHLRPWQYMQSTIDTMVKAILDGAVDQFLHVDRGSVAKLFEAYAANRRALPPLVTEYLTAARQYSAMSNKSAIECYARSSTSMPFEKTRLERQKQKEGAKRREELRRLYDLHFDGYDLNLHFMPHNCPGLFTDVADKSSLKFPFDKYTPREYIERNPHDRTRYENIVRSLPKTAKVLKRSEVTNILEENNIGNLLQLCRQDFICEDLGIEV